MVEEVEEAFEGFVECGFPVPLLLQDGLSVGIDISYKFSMIAEVKELKAWKTALAGAQQVAAAS